MLVDEATYLDGARVAEGQADNGKSFSWIGLFDSTVSELHRYQDRFQLNDLAVEDALFGKQRPKIDLYNEHTLIVLKSVAYNVKTEKIIVGDLTLFIGTGMLLTVRHGDALPLQSIRADLELHPEKLKGGPSAVLHEITDRMVDQYLEVATMLTEDVNQIEDEVFDDEIPASASRMYFVKRELIEFRRAVWPLVEPLDRLAKGAVPFVSADSALLFADVRDHLLKVIDEVDTLNALMDAALHANVALIQVKQNEDMRKISSWIAIGAVPTMIAGIYGMNFEHMPELETQYGYYVVVGLLAAVSYGLFRLFRKNEWL